MPREFPDQGKIEFTAKIPKPMYDEFVGFLPIFGANSWFIATALNHFLNLLRNDPVLVSRVRQAVEQTIKEV